MTAAPSPRESLERCALRAQLRGDAMLGTAFPASRLLLVEQPGPWGRDGLTQSRFDPVIARALIAHAGRARVLAIRRSGRTPAGTRRRWASIDCRPGHERAVWGYYDRDDELLSLDEASGTPDETPTYLVCAHSRHDTCCALRGRPVAAALAQVRPGRVWECSHVGGERFAANVLVLPFGMLYGRMLPFAARDFVETIDRGDVVPALLRGRVGLTPVAQAALALAYEQFGERRVDALRVRSASAVVDGHAVVRVEGPDGQLDVTVAVERVDADGLTCASPRASYYLRHRPISAVAVRA